MKSPASKEFVSLVVVIYIILLIPYFLFFSGTSSSLFIEGPEEIYVNGHTFSLSSEINFVSIWGGYSYTNYLRIYLHIQWDIVPAVPSYLDHTTLDIINFAIRNQGQIWSPPFTVTENRLEVNININKEPVPNWKVGDLVDFSITFTPPWFEDPITLNDLNKEIGLVKNS